nr:MAG TPA: replisome organizer [Caudoviricetes sp.]
MFAKTIIDSDAFLDMPASSQMLYFHLAMRADDDGFVNNPKKIQRMIGAADDDLKLLLVKNFILAFDTGIIVIRHWKIHNYIRNDRYTPTVYQEEREQLTTTTGGYTKKVVSGIPTVSKLDTQVSIGKDRIGKYNIYIGEVVDFLNALCGTNYRKNSSKTQSFIKARLNEGYTVDDFKTVISKKAKEWKGTEMEKYLRPETLFGTKFESYLNAKIIKKEELQAAIGGQKIERRDYNADQLQGLFTDLGED